MKKRIIFLALIGLSFLQIPNAYSQLYEGNAYYDSTGKVYYYANDGKAYYYPEDVQRQYQRNRHMETSTEHSANQYYQNKNYLTKNNLLDVNWWKTATAEKVKQEIVDGADVNAEDNEYGATPIVFATAVNPYPEVIKTLLKYGADVNNLNVLAVARNNPNQQVTNLIISEIERSYNEADYSDRSDFEDRVSNCILTEELEQDFRSSLSMVDQFELTMISAFSLGTQDTQRTKECQCIFNAVEAYLGEAEYNKAIEAFNQGRQGTFKKTVKKAIPAAFAVCF